MQKRHDSPSAILHAIKLNDREAIRKRRKLNLPHEPKSKSSLKRVDEDKSYIVSRTEIEQADEMIIRKELILFMLEHDNNKNSLHEKVEEEKWVARPETEEFEEQTR